MPASKTVFIPHSCFGYYDQTFNQCSKKCSISKSCKNATQSSKFEQIRKIYKYKKSQIKDLVNEWK